MPSNPAMKSTIDFMGVLNRVWTYMKIKVSSQKAESTDSI
jgi:hypothetical protein